MHPPPTGGFQWPWGFWRNTASEGAEIFYKVIKMSTTTEEIIEKLKTITLFEAAELVSRIEETFGVDASAPSGGFASAP